MEDFCYAFNESVLKGSNTTTSEFDCFGEKTISEDTARFLCDNACRAMKGFESEVFIKLNNFLEGDNISKFCDCITL